MATALGVVLPGTTITELVEKSLAGHRQDASRKEAQTEDALPLVKLGAGLIQAGDNILAVKPGILHFARPNKFWLESRQKRYVPAANDLVIGIITARLADSYRVELGSSSQATLPFTGFEGITKKNRPNLAIGDVIYGRVSIANKDLEPELVCLDTENRPEGFGELKDGMLFHCPSSYSRRLQRDDAHVLETLGKHFAFEIIIGANGRFVLIAGKVADTIKLANIIIDSQFHVDADLRWLYDRINAIARSS